jgi:F0F1-type ATP synthase membrane subunit b/b'
MAVFFLLLAFLLVVVVGAAGLENTDPSSATLFDRSFSQLSEGQLLVLAAALGFLVALFLFLAFGASRARRSRRKELKSRRRDAEGRVDELERENARLEQELTGAREELQAIDRDRSDAVAERDRAEATVDRVRSGADARREPAEAANPAHDPTGTTAVDEQARAGSHTAATPPEPTNVRRERLDDRTGVSPALDEHARAAADEEARRR